MSKYKNTALIIPMAGKGSRFYSAGYETYKAFIKINGRTMLEGVIEPFKDCDNIYIITTQDIVKSNSVIFDNLSKNVRIIEIDDHKLGPAYSIYMAEAQLPKDKSLIVSYCDVWWTQLELGLEHFLDEDAVILVHRGFHPHLVRDNFSAFCQEDLENPSYLRQIREKGSFTDEWMGEPLSVGVFYAKDPMEFYSSINRLIQNKGLVAGEFYPSMIFNDLVSQGMGVRLVDVESFVHLGLPSHLRDFEFWSELDRDNANSGLHIFSDNFQHCMLIGGSGSRMKGVSDLQKHMIPVDGKPMFRLVSEKFDTKETLIIGAPDIDLGVDDLPNSFIVKLLKKNTASHLETLIKAVEILEKDRPILFTSCDCYGSIDAQKLEEQITKYNPDAVVFGFEPSLMHEKNTNQHTTILIKDGHVVDVDIKSKNKNYSKGLAGFFWFKDTELILNQLEKSNGNKEGELLVDHLIDEMVRSKKKVICLQIDPYIHLGTPNEYFEYTYWTGRGKRITSSVENSANG